MMVARLGLQKGVGQTAWRKRTPSRARRSKAGVLMTGLPATPMAEW